MYKLTHSDRWRTRKWLKVANAATTMVLVQILYTVANGMHCKQHKLELEYRISRCINSQFKADSHGPTKRAQANVPTASCVNHGFVS